MLGVGGDVGGGWGNFLIELCNLFAFRKQAATYHSYNFDIFTILFPPNVAHTG